MKQVNEVALMIIKDGKILVERRKLTKETDPGKIVIPEGHIEEGESFEETCKREIQEEFGIHCDKFEFVCKLTHDAGSESKIIHYFLCKGWCGEPKIYEAEEIFWISPDKHDILDYEINRKAIKTLFEKFNIKTY